MASAGTNLGKRAVKATARHEWHGFTAKAQRKPLRSATLFSAGTTIGLVVGWVAGRTTARRGEGLPPAADGPGTAPPSQAGVPDGQPAQAGQPEPDV